MQQTFSLFYALLFLRYIKCETALFIDLRNKSTNKY